MSKILSPIKHRILKYVEDKRVKKSLFFNSINASASNFRSSGLKSEVGGDVIAKILSNYPEISAEWLITGQGSMLKGQEYSSKIEPSSIHEEEDKERNLFNKRTIIKPTSEATHNTFVADINTSENFVNLLDDPRKFEQLPSISLPYAPFGLNVAFQIKGDSMDNNIRNHDFVAASQIDEPFDILDGNTYIIIDRDHGVVCKRIYHEGDAFRLESDNPSYPPYTRSRDDFHAVFKCFMRLSTDFSADHDDLRSLVHGLQLKVDGLERRVNS